MKRQIVLTALAALLLAAGCGGMEGDEALDQIASTTSEIVVHLPPGDTDPQDPGDTDVPPVCDPEEPDPDEPWGPPTCPPPAPEPDCPQGPLGPCTDP